MRILAFAYACEPGRGSEPGAGWLWARLLGGLADTTVITRTNNRTQIEQALPLVPEAAALRFRYVDLPPWARGWKRGRRGVHTYYLLWQLLALMEARRLRREEPFDLVWHLTMANIWFGSLAQWAGRPFVYGPVGGAARTPAALLRTLGPKGMASEIVRATVLLAARYLNPLARGAWRGAALILVQNRESLEWLPLRRRRLAHVLPNVVIDPDLPRRRPPPSGRSVAMYAGELRPLKGVVLAVDAVTALPGWRLLVAGSGPDAGRIRRRAQRRGVDDRVTMLGSLPRDELLRTMRDDVDVLLFPSLHDQAGWVVAEALVQGLPVVCLDVGGPPALGGTPVPPGAPAATAQALAAAVPAAAREPVPPRSYDLASRRETVRVLLEQHGLLRTAASARVPR